MRANRIYISQKVAICSLLTVCPCLFRNYFDQESAFLLMCKNITNKYCKKLILMLRQDPYPLVGLG